MLYRPSAPQAERVSRVSPVSTVPSTSVNACSTVASLGSPASGRTCPASSSITGLSCSGSKARTDSEKLPREKCPTPSARDTVASWAACCSARTESIRGFQTYSSTSLQ